MKKTWLLLVFCTVCALTLVGCTSNADTLPSASPSTSLSPSPTMMATTSPTATTSPSTTAGAMTLEDSRRIAEAIDEEVEKLSEISESSVVVSGNMALVGVTFDTSYQGGVTDRITEMIDTRIATVDKAITAVHVTDDKTLVAEIQKLSDEVQKGEITFSQLQTRMLEISNTISGTNPTLMPTSTTGTGA